MLPEHRASIDTPARPLEAAPAGLTLLRRGLQSGSRRLLNLLLPPQCLHCRALVDAAHGLCADCWRAIDFLSAPCCAACGMPFEFELGPGSLCAACLRRRPRYDRARAAMRYNDASRGLLLGFKHGDRTEFGRSFGQWMLRAGAELLRDADLIVPVPLHRWRLLKRRYNQSAILARTVSRAARVPLAVDLLVRRRSTDSQGGLNARQRHLNVRGAFAVREAGRAGLQGRRVLLIDDVMTTGATADACARALLQAGASQIDVLTLARVVRPQGNPI